MLQIHSKQLNKLNNTNFPTGKKIYPNKLNHLNQSNEKENVDPLSKCTLNYISLGNSKVNKPIQKEEMSESTCLGNIPLLRAKKKEQNRFISLKRKRAQLLKSTQSKQKQKRKKKKAQTITLNLFSKPKNLVEDDSDLEEIKEEQTIDQYTDEEYQFDLKQLLNHSAKHCFMYDNFPSTYEKIPFFYNIKPEKSIDETQAKIPYQTNRDTFIKNNHTMISQHKWSPSNKESSKPYDVFIQKIESQWNHNATKFNIELILEFVMKNDYNWDYCLRNIQECIKYVIANQSHINTNIKPKQMIQVKERSYCLREPKLKQFGHSVFNKDYFTYF